MLSRLVALACQASDVILEVYARADLVARDKSDGSPVTEADGLAEEVILAGLAESFPDIPVVAEEAVAAGKTPLCGDRFFLVDPLDGTREFIRRTGEFTVNIGLVEHGRPTVGVVLAPATGALFVGDAHGARRAVYRDGTVSAWSPIAARAAPPDGLRVVASRTSLNPETQAFLAAFQVAELVQASSSLKLCLVAAGEADLYPRMGCTMGWDIAAGDAVLRAAGGMVRCLDGQPFTYEPGRVSGGQPFENPWFVACGAFDPMALVESGRHQRGAE